MSLQLTISLLVALPVLKNSRKYLGILPDGWRLCLRGIREYGIIINTQWKKNRID